MTTSNSPLSLNALLRPRESVFSAARTDTVLDLKDLIEGRINPSEFFEENYLTGGLNTLLTQAFERLSGQSDNGLFLMRQSMGGGKTHSLISLGLLAMNPTERPGIVENPERYSKLGKVQVVAFDGRESDAQHGIWGSIAKQLGQPDAFAHCYSPLSAPGVSSWEELLKGRTALILLDELPPYMDGAEAKQIGDSNLARVTTQALSNLFAALQRPACKGVCVVMTDLAATSYQSSSHYLRDALTNLQKEAGRLAVELEPVRLNSGELYDILRKRLFTAMPSDAAIHNVARAYSDAVDDGHAMGLTSLTGAEMLPSFVESYPFHPALRDLYARFKDNRGFQQTRGLIRLMRATTTSMWESGLAGERLMIGVQDLNLNEAQIRNEIFTINGDMQQAIAHDIADEGRAVAERQDATGVAADAARLILISSLSNVVDGVVGLSSSEIMAYLTRPGVDISAAHKQLEALGSRAWYLHHNSADHSYHFDAVQNFNAQIESTYASVTEDSSVERARKLLTQLFHPSPESAYSRLLVFPTVQEVQESLGRGEVTLVITRPGPGGGVQPELLKLYSESEFKNRVMFLTGERSNYTQLQEIGRKLYAVEVVGRKIGNSDKTSDEQKDQVVVLTQSAHLQFREAVRSAFTQLHYPQQGGLSSVEFNFVPAPFKSRTDVTGDTGSGAAQITDLLKLRAKFTPQLEDKHARVFEARVFTQPRLSVGELEARAAGVEGWVWHPRGELERLTQSKVDRDEWRRDGSSILRGPFAAEPTSVSVLLLSENREKGSWILEVTPRGGQVVHYAEGEQVGESSPTLSSATYEATCETVSFLAVDESGKHPTGESVTWNAPLQLSVKIKAEEGERFAVFHGSASGSLTYSVDGSNPEQGQSGVLGERIPLPTGTSVVQGLLRREGARSVTTIARVDWQRAWAVNPREKAVWKAGPRDQTTAGARSYIDRLKKHDAQASDVTIVVQEGQSEDRYVRLQLGSGISLMGTQLEEILNYVRRQVSDQAEISLKVRETRFERGQDLLDWAQESSLSVEQSEVTQ